MTKLHKEAHSTLQAKPLAFANRMLALEPRYIFDAAMATELADIVHVTSDTGYSGPAAADTGAEMVAAARELSAFDAIHDGSGAPVSEAEFQSAISTYVDAHNLASANDEVAFVDSRLADLGTLISSIPDGTRIVLIDGSRDGVEQMTAALEDMQGITGVHIISHGTAGALQLGTSTLDAETMSGMYREALSGIRDNLDPDADILIYGCNFAAGQSGANAVALLAELTGADVAASDDLTGTGGDWELEVSAGAVEAIGLSPKAWAHTLDLAITNVGVTGGPSGVTGANVNALANQILGGGVTINSATYYGGALQAATFVTGAGSSFGSNVLAFTDGAIFSTGTAVSVAGPNNSPGFTVDAPGIDNNAEFNALAGGSTRDASYITINFTPDVPPGASAGDTGRMTMQIVFGSDEYNEYVYGSVNDTMAIIVNGQNKAVVPNGLAIGIDTINAAGTYNPAFGSPTLDPNPEHVGAGFESANPSLYVNNDTGALNTQMDGFTITLPVTFDVIVGQANTITIGIADTADPLLDSWMFVKANSGQTVIIAEGDSVITPTNVPITIDVTANDFDLQGDPLTITHINDALVSPGDVITLASGATVTIGVGGSITIEGDGINPANDAFTYAITDGNGGSSLAFVNVTLTAPLINTAPVGVNDNIPATEDAPVTQNVLGNDTDVDSDPLTISGASIDWNGDGVPDPIVLGSPTAIVSSTGAAIGVITVNGNGDVTFAPSQNYTGPVPNLTYTPNDGTVDGTPATVTFGPIVPVNDAPDAVDGTVTTAYLTPVVVDFTGNDTDADGDPLTVTAATLTDPASGTLSEDPVTGVWTFTPAVGYSGDAVISYTITDQDGATDTATHTVTVANALPALTDPAPGVPGTPEIDPSDPSNLLVAATDGVPLTLAAGSYFTDPNGDPLTITPDMTGVPAWLSYDPLTQTFSGTPPVDNAGHSDRDPGGGR